MPCEPDTFSGGTTQASARLAMLMSLPTLSSFHWFSMSIRTTDWLWSAGMWADFNGEWKLDMMSYNIVIRHATNNNYNGIWFSDNFIIMVVHLVWQQKAGLIQGIKCEQN